MKSNYAKYFIVLLWLTLSITSINSYAFFVQSPKMICYWGLWGVSSISFPNCSVFTSTWSNNSIRTSNTIISSDYIDDNYMYFEKSKTNWDYLNYRYTINSSIDNVVVVSWNLYSYNDGDTLNIQYYNWSSWYNVFQYSFVNIDYDWSIVEFKWRDDFNKRYNSVLNYSLPSLPDVNGANDSFEYFAPRHWSFVFYNAAFRDEMHTLQYIWNRVLTDKVIYVDTLATSDNVWLINYNKKKAWSMTLNDDDFLRQFMFWVVNLGDDYIDDYWREDSYTITLNTWWNYFFPNTDWNKVYNNSNLTRYYTSTTSSRINPGFTFTRDLEYENPDYSSNSSNNQSWSAVDNDAIMSFEECSSKIWLIKNLASNEYACRWTISSDCSCEFWNCSCFSNNDFNSMYNFLRNYDWIDDFTWNIWGVSCSQWYNKAKSLYFWEWSWNYLRNFLVANDWSVSPNDIEVSNYCWDYPSTSSEQSWLCRITGVGCNDSLWQIFDIFKQNLLIFYKEPIDFITSDFNRWYNYFWTGYQCVNMYWNNKSYSWWNYLLMFVLWRLWFVLYSVFKD